MGTELKALKDVDLPESEGLNCRIERYEGKRPIGLWRWDLECLLDTLSMILEEPADRQSPPINKLALKTLHNRLRQEYDSSYGRTGI